MVSDDNGHRLQWTANRADRPFALDLSFDLFYHCHPDWFIPRMT